MRFSSYRLIAKFLRCNKIRACKVSTEFKQRFITAKNCSTPEKSWRLHSGVIHLSTYVRSVGAWIYEKNANASRGARSYGDHFAEIRNVAHIRVFRRAGASIDVSKISVTWDKSVPRDLFPINNSKIYTKYTYMICLQRCVQQLCFFLWIFWF